MPLLKCFWSKSLKSAIFEMMKASPEKFHFMMSFVDSSFLGYVDHVEGVGEELGELGLGSFGYFAVFWRGMRVFV